MSIERYIPAIELRTDPEQIAQITQELRGIKNGVAKAIAPAINKTTAKGRTACIKAFTQVLATKRAEITHRIVTTKASPDSLVGKIRIQQRRIGLINFKVQDTRQAARRGDFSKRHQKRLGAIAGSGSGVIVQVRKDETPLRLPKAFVAIGLGKDGEGNRHVFERFGKKHRYTKAHYRPNIGKLKQNIRSLKGESLHTVWREVPSIRAATQNMLYTEFPRQIASQVDRLLKRSKAK